MALKRSPRGLSAFTRGTDTTDPVGRDNTQATGSTVTDWRKRDPLKHRPSSALSEKTREDSSVIMSNDIKTNMPPPKTSGPTIGRPEHPNTEKAEENKLQYNFLKMIDIFKEEIRISLKK